MNRIIQPATHQRELRMLKYRNDEDAAAAADRHQQSTTQHCAAVRCSDLCATKRQHGVAMGRKAAPLSSSYQSYTSHHQ